MFSGIILTADELADLVARKKGHDFTREDFYAFELMDGTYALPEINLRNKAFGKFKATLAKAGLLNNLTIRDVLETEIKGHDDD